MVLLETNSFENNLLTLINWKSKNTENKILDP